MAGLGRPRLWLKRRLSSDNPRILRHGATRLLRTCSNVHVHRARYKIPRATSNMNFRVPIVKSTRKTAWPSNCMAYPATFRCSGVATHLELSMNICEELG